MVDSINNVGSNWLAGDAYSLKIIDRFPRNNRLINNKRTAHVAFWTSIAVIFAWTYFISDSYILSGAQVAQSSMNSFPPSPSNCKYISSGALLLSAVELSFQAHRIRPKSGRHIPGISDPCCTAR